MPRIGDLIYLKELPESTWLVLSTPITENVVVSRRKKKKYPHVCTRCWVWHIQQNTRVEWGFYETWLSHFEIKCELPLDSPEV